MSPENTTRLGAIGEGEGERAPILDVDRVGLDEGSLVRPQARRDIADVAGHAGNADRLTARLRLDLLEIEHGRKRMASHPDQRAAAGHCPLRRVRRMRAAVALFALHEQDLVPGGFQDLRGLGHRRRVDPVFRIHEELAGLPDRRAGLVHFLKHALVHQGFRHVLADRGPVAVPPEITGEWLFADDMLAGVHGVYDHRGMQIGRRADVYDIHLAVRDQVAKPAADPRYPVPTGEIENMISPRRDSSDLDIDAVDASVGIHMQLRNEAATHQTDSDFRHPRIRP